MEMAKKSGIDMKCGQAQNIVKNKRKNTFAFHVASYSWLESYFKSLHEIDVDGMYLIDVCDEDIDGKSHHAFYCAFVAFEAMKAMWWRGVWHVMAVEGTFTMTVGFKHTLLLVATNDMINRLV